MDDSAEKSLVPSVSTSAAPASGHAHFETGIRLSRSTSVSRVCSVCRVRSPKFWLGLLSTMTAATEGNGIAVLAS